MTDLRGAATMEPAGSTVAQATRAGAATTDEETATFLRGFMEEFRDHVERVLTVLPRNR